MCGIHMQVFGSKWQNLLAPGFLLSSLQRKALSPQCLENKQKLPVPTNVALTVLPSLL